jgi:DNA-directed RNA polymerase subunit RPC12/RpoP
MAPVNFVCEACGQVLAVLDRAGAEPALRIATGLTFRADGGAACPACGHRTKINFSNLGALLPGAAKTN